MFVPSKTGMLGLVPTVTVWRIVPAGSSFRRALRDPVTQADAPSQRAPMRLPPIVTVVTVQGSDAVGVTMETLPSALATQRRAPSKAIPAEEAPMLVATVVTAPAG